MDPSNLITTIEKWQTLAGAFLGPFLAVILSGLGYLVGRKYIAYKERREAYRRTEIALTISLNEIYSAKEKLVNFIGKLRGLSESVQSVSDGAAYFLDEINFPPIKEIHVEKDFPYRKFKSYYLHNKLLQSYSGIESTNLIIRGLKEDYKEMLKKNEFLVALKSAPGNQKEAYRKNLENFARAITGFIPWINEGIKTLTQCKVYNLKLLEKKRVSTWKHEGITLKYFKNNKRISDYCQHLDSLDRIDKIIDGEVNKLITEANKRQAG